MLKVGDVVMVKKDLIAEKRYGQDLFVKKMSKYRGNVGKITECLNDFNEFKLDIDDGTFFWTEEMLEPINKELTIYSTDNEFIVERKGEFITDKPYEFDNAINTVIRYAEDEMYPNFGSTYYVILKDLSTYKYCVKELIWENLINEKEQFDRNDIFLDKEKAEEVADKFNKVMEEYNND